MEEREVREDPEEKEEERKERKEEVALEPITAKIAEIVPQLLTPPPPDVPETCELNEEEARKLRLTDNDWYKLTFTIAGEEKSTYGLSASALHKIQIRYRISILPPKVEYIADEDGTPRYVRAMVTGIRTFPDGSRIMRSDVKKLDFGVKREQIHIKYEELREEATGDQAKIRRLKREERKELLKLQEFAEEITITGAIERVIRALTGIPPSAEDKYIMEYKKEEQARVVEDKAKREAERARERAPTDMVILPDGRKTPKEVVIEIWKREESPPKIVPHIAEVMGKEPEELTVEDVREYFSRK